MTTNAKVQLDGLVEVAELKGELRKRKDKYVYETVDKALGDKYKAKGWELSKRNKKTDRMKRLKSHDVYFEDRVWALLAALDFNLINTDRNFRLAYSENPDITAKQIDVFVVDSDTALVVECKSASKRTRSSFSKDIAEIVGIKSEILKRLKKQFKRSLKVRWIFATSNVIVTKPDAARMADNDIVHFNDEDIEYYEQLGNLLGPTAKYQLLGRLFQNQKIEGLKYSTPAIRGHLGGFKTYSFSVEPEVLLRIGFVLHRTDSSEEAFKSYQRMVKKARIKQIENYINDDGFFPNSIIINFNTKRALSFKPVPSAKHSSMSELGILHLPNAYHSAFIIDGQHRLYGYGNTEWKSKNTIPVVAFENLPEKEQTRIFVDINNKQKSVPQSLLITLMGEFNWGSVNADEALSAVKTRLIDYLSSKIDSPLYKRIKLLDEPGSNTRCLTKNYLIGQALNKTNFFGLVQKKKLVKHGYLWTGDYQSTLDKSYDFLSACFQFIENDLSSQWSLGKAEGGFITMNLGVSSSIRVINDILLYLDKTASYDFATLSGEELAGLVKEYFEPVAAYLKGLTYEEIKKLRGFVGGSAVDRVLREFQNAINQKHSGFEPEGFAQWRKDNSGKFNAKAKALGDEMQLRVRDFIFDALKAAFGTANDRWWNDGVHSEIQIRCSIERIKKGDAPGTEYTQMYLLDYQRIIFDRKDLLLEVFTAPGNERLKQSKKLDWFVKWNNIRSKYSHPERGKVTEKEFEYLQQLESWLYVKI